MRAYQVVATNESPKVKLPNTFSENEKKLLILSLITLAAGTVLFRELYLLFSQAKPRLEETAHGIENYCTASATGAIQIIFNQCIAPNNATAFYDLGNANGISPYFSSTKTVPVPVRIVDSWFDPFAWINYFTCLNNQTENLIRMTGHVFSGTPKTVLEKASNGFTVITANISTISTPLFGIGNKTIEPAMEMFLAGFCILIQNGGYSLYRNEHFNGFERRAESFGKYADRFAIIYLSFTIAASLATTVLLCKKALHNARLFKKPDENQNSSIQSREERDPTTPTEAGTKI